MGDIFPLVTFTISLMFRHFRSAIALSTFMYSLQFNKSKQNNMPIEENDE